MKRLLFTLTILGLYSCGGNKPTPDLDVQLAGVNLDIDASEEFTAVDYGPVGVVDNRIARNNIYVVFSKPVVPLAKLGKVITDSDTFKMEPAMKGIYRWYGTRYLSFTPSEPLAPSTRYTVTLNPELRSLTGKKLKGEQTFEFISEPLELWSFFPGNLEQPMHDYDVPLEAARHVTLIFSAEVEPETISQFIQVTADDWKVDFDASQPEIGKDASRYHWYKADYPVEEFQKHILVLDLKSELEEEMDVKVVIAKGAYGKAGQAPLQEKISKSYSTLEAFKFESVDTGSRYPNARMPIYLYFSHQLDPERKVQASDIELIPAREIKPENVIVRGSRITLINLAVEPEESYRIKVNTQNIFDIYGRKLDRDISTSRFTFEAARSYITFHRDTSNFIMEAAYPPKILLEYQNLDERATKLEIGAYKSLEEKPSRPVYLRDNFQVWGQNFSRLPEFDQSDARRNYANYRLLDFSPYLNQEGFGQVYYWWMDMNKSKVKLLETGSAGDFKYRDFRQVFGKFQVSNLAVSARIAYNQAIAMISHLDDGKAAPGVAVRLYLNNSTSHSAYVDGVSDADGMVVFDDLKIPYEHRYDLRFELTEASDHLRYDFGNDHYANRDGVQTRSLYKYSSDYDFVFTDRGLYRPGETLSFVGISRNLSEGKYERNTNQQAIAVIGNQRDAKPFFTQKLENNNGFFSSSFQIPKDLEPGWYNVKTNNGGVSFQVANFRRLTFSVGFQAANELPVVAGDAIIASASAKYLAGGGLGGAKYDLSWEMRPTSFQPTKGNYDDYSFGPNAWGGTKHLSTDSGQLDGQGKLSIRKETGGEQAVIGKPYNYTAQISVIDAASQEVSARKSFTVHPAEFYIGIKSEKYFLAKGKKNTFDIALVDLNSEKYTAATDVQIELIRREWKQVTQQGVYGDMVSRYEQEEVEERTIEQKISKGRSSITLQPEKSGYYLIRMKAKDKLGRSVYSEISMYASGSGMVYWGYGERDNSNSVQKLGLVSDRDQYNPGDTATLLLQSPLPEGKYLLTLEREGILEHKVLDLKGSTNELKIPITDNFIPVVYVSVTSYSGRTEEPPEEFGAPDLGKPKGYFGVLPLFINTDKRNVKVEIVNSKPTYLPGETASVTLKASQNGKPASNIDLVFMAVDRGVVDLIDYHVPDPVAYFYSIGKFPLRVKGAESRSALLNPVNYSIKNLQGGDGAGGKDKTRKDFNPTAVFRSNLRTDANGEVQFTFKLPDTLTTYRSTAIAIARNSFGRKEDEIYVQNPINMKGALPRKLRVRDRADLGVIVSNTGAETQKIEIRAQGSENLNLEVTKRNLTLQPGTTEFVSFPTVALRSGEAVLNFALDSAVLQDRLEQRLMVEKPYVYESFTTVGKLDSGIPEGSEKLAIPGSAVDGKGELILKFSNGNFSILNGALRYLDEYRYYCAEQSTSKLLPYVVLGDLMPKVYPEGLVRTKKQIQAEVDRVLKQQNTDGSFSFWLEKGARGSLFASNRVGFFAYIARSYGYKLDFKKAELISFIMDELEREDKYLSDSAKVFSYYVAAMLDEPSKASEYTEKIRAIIDEVGKGPTGLYGSLLLGLSMIRAGESVDKLHNQIKQYIKPGTRSIDFANLQNFPSSSYYNSEAEVLALYLMFLTQTKERSGLAEKVMNTLVGRLSYGNWGGTLTNAMVITAFSIWNPPGNSMKPVQAVATLNGEDLLQANFKDQTEDDVQKAFSFEKAPLKGLERDALQDLAFKLKPSNSDADIYYSAELKYSIPAEEQFPRDEGLSVFYEIQDMTGKIMGTELDLGQTYRMNVYLSSSRDRDNLIVKTPLPSGAEVLDGSFVTSGRKPEAKDDDDDEYDYRWWWWRYRARQFIHDNHVLTAYEHFQQGYRKSSFLFRTTTAGKYPTPPVQAEAMYEPEVFGRSSGTLFIIR